MTIFRHDPTAAELVQGRTFQAPIKPHDVIAVAKYLDVQLVNGRIPHERVHAISYELERTAGRRSLIDNKHYFYAPGGHSHDFALCWTCNAPRHEACHYDERAR